MQGECVAKATSSECQLPCKLSTGLPLLFTLQCIPFLPCLVHTHLRAAVSCAKQAHTIRDPTDQPVAWNHIRMGYTSRLDINFVVYQLWVHALASDRACVSVLCT